MSAGPRVLLMQLSERTSGRGNRYLSGWLGKASVVAAVQLAIAAALVHWRLRVYQRKEAQA